MPLFEEFPYTNYHELNLDYLMEELAKIRTLDSVRALYHETVNNIGFNHTFEEDETIVVFPAVGTVAFPHEGYYYVEFAVRTTANAATLKLAPTINGAVQTWSLTTAPRGRVNVPQSAGSVTVGGGWFHFPGGECPLSFAVTGSAGNTFGLTDAEIYIYGVGGENIV